MVKTVLLGECSIVWEEEGGLVGSNNSINSAMTGPCAENNDEGSAHNQKPDDLKLLEYDNSVRALASSTACGSRWCLDRQIPDYGTFRLSLYSEIYCTAFPIFALDWKACRSVFTSQFKGFFAWFEKSCLYFQFKNDNSKKILSIKFRDTYESHKL